MKEDILALVDACFDEQFDKGWDEGVQAAFDIVQEVLGSGADLLPFAPGSCKNLR